MPGIFGFSNHRRASTVLSRRVTHVLNNCSGRYKSERYFDCMSNLRLTAIICLPPNEISILILCYVLAFMSACTQNNGKNYFPLADGARWEYAGQSSSPNSKQISFRATARIDGETLINSKRYFKYVLTSDFSSVPEIGKIREYVRYYRIAEDGIYFRAGNDPNGLELLEMPLPIPISTKWLSGNTEVQAEHVETIQIGDRQYRNCLKVTFKPQGGAHILENYLAPAVGVIKFVDVSTSEPKSIIELTLEKYEP
jgi:hypothetical protein